MILLKERIRLALDLRAGEEKLVALLLLHSLLQGIALAYFFTAANALFLERLDIRNLSWVYLVAGLASMSLAVLYSRIEHRHSLSQLLQWSIIVLVPAVLLLWLLLGVTSPVLIAFILLAWYHVMHYLIDSRFWELSAVLFDVRQSKRLFGLVSLGESVAKVVGYLSIPLLVYFVGTNNLLLFAAGMLMLSLPVLRRLLERHGVHVEGVLGHDDGGFVAPSGPAAGGAFPPLADRRHILLLGAFTLFSFSSLAFLDFGFLGSVQQRFIRDGEIAPFLGVFFGVAKALNIAARAFLSGRIIRRYGLLVGLIALPSMLFILSLAIIGVGLSGSGDRLSLLLFGFTVLLSEVLRGPIANTAFLILFQPLSPRRRLEAHALAKAKGEPAALVASGAILVAISYTSNSFYYVSVSLAALAAGWIIISFLIKHEYGTIIRESLRKRVLRGGSLELADSTTTSILESHIRSEDPVAVVYALNLLIQTGDGRVQDHVLGLATHRSAFVRMEALRKIEELRVSPAVPVLERMIVSEPDGRVKEFAVAVYCSLAGERGITATLNLIQSHDPEVSTGAVIGLLRSGHLAGIVAAGQRLTTLAESIDPSDRAKAARVIGEVGNPGFYHPLLPLLADEDRVVRHAAMKACGSVRNPALVEPLAQALLDAGDAVPAATALAEIGEESVAALRALFADCDDVHVLKRACRIVDRIGTDEARSVLCLAFLHHHREVRDQAVTSFALGRFSTPEGSTRLALEAVRAELGDAATLLMEIRQIRVACTSEADIVVGALDNELRRLRDRVLLLLSIPFDHRSILQSRDRLSSQDSSLRANAIEILEMSLPRDLADQVLPLFEERDSEQLYKRLAISFPHAVLQVDDCLNEIVHNELGRHSPWTRACALRLAIAAGALDATSVGTGLLADRDRIVRETAAELLAEASRELEDSDATKPDHTTKAMLTTIEKVMTLKLAEMFSETPEEFLVDVAEALQEIFVGSGVEVIRKGDPGNCMYIIHEGSVLVHDGDHEFGRFGARDHFGELSLLDPEPRSASVTTLEETCLLRLDQDALYEIMADSTEVARGILRNLTRRLRAQNQLIVQLEGMREEPE